ncbi:hypothetical protein ULMS_19140 [Patiriisocius marinistellae]|uniref:Uncharacterized protein n=1 Tax=Patiriisocius marinistellae TaxID=2494560 RepID=A0A5J4G1I6_9FLAO|nr:hypothetical protein [Patiriisocius marinistellae]GEQ86406.1 hypothetical protein ULMS_19140 [Patiriisocius marinistellae]
MEQIRVIFYVLSSFFATENGQIASEFTTVTIDPVNSKIEIVLEKLFTVLQSEDDKQLVKSEWHRLNKNNIENLNWANDLKNFVNKTILITETETKTQVKIELNYKSEKDLETLGIWYKESENQFAINYLPDNNLETKEGVLRDIYWYFKADSIFKFKMEPFLNMPTKYKKDKKPLIDIIKQ